MTRGRVGIARSSSAVASSDGHNISRFKESRSTTWMLPERRIFVGGARRSPIFLSLGQYVKFSGSLDLYRTAMTKQDLRSWLTIAVRSWPDCPAIRADLSWN